jgi:hypothetical protein
MILFLNKTDLFAEKIKKTSINTAFPMYTGKENYHILHQAVYEFLSFLICCNRYRFLQKAYAQLQQLIFRRERALSVELLGERVRTYAPP